jgi:hypothetical protein
MVISSKDHRYYGRGATGNVLLTESQVSLLYERRKGWERNAEKLLADWVDHAPLGPESGFAYLYMVAAPVGAPDDLLQRASAAGKSEAMLREAAAMASGPNVFPPFQGGWAPNIANPTDMLRTVSGWRLYMGYAPEIGRARDPLKILDVEVDHNGTGRLFAGRAAQRVSDSFLVLEPYIAEVATRFLALLGTVYDLGHFFGPVDLGVAVTGLVGTSSFYAHGKLVPPSHYPLIDVPEYRRATRTMAATLHEDAKNAASRLLLPLIEATTQGHHNPFSTPAGRG